LLVTTFVRDELQVRQCQAQARQCHQRIWATVSSEQYYLANADQFPIDIAHSVRAPTFHDQYRAAHGDDTMHYYGGFAEDLHGVLMQGRRSKQVLVEFARGSTDVMSVHSLLKAVDMTFEQVRHEGVTLYADLAYSNARCNSTLSCAFGVVPISYRYRITAVPDAGVCSKVRFAVLCVAWQGGIDMLVAESTT
jgi:hypothetical protein